VPWEGCFPREVKQELDPSSATEQPQRRLGSRIHIHQGCWVLGPKQLWWEGVQGLCDGREASDGVRCFQGLLEENSYPGFDLRKPFATWESIWPHPVF